MRVSWNFLARPSGTFAGLMGVMLLLTSISAKADDSQAQAMAVVEETAAEVVAAIADNQDALRADPEALLQIVDDILLPRVDFDRMSRLTLGRFWARASEQERAEFQVEFRRLLVRTYAGPLSSLGDQEIVVTGVRPGADENDLLVRSEVRDGGQAIPVDYRMHRESGDWMAYDVIIDGISLINNYRGSFGQQIQRDGMRGLIETLRSRNR